MSTKKKGLLTTSMEWAKHLRPWGKRKFWKRERSRVRTTFITRNGKFSV